MAKQAGVEEGIKDGMGDRERQELVSRGWTAYLLDAISLSRGNAHACSSARENRRTDTQESV